MIKAIRSALFPTSVRARTLALLALTGAFVVGVVAVGALKHLQTQYSVMQFLPENHPAIKMDQDVRERFNIVDRPTFIGLITLTDTEPGTWLEPARMQQLEAATEAVAGIPGATMALSVSNVDGAADLHGNLNVGKLVKLLPPENWKNRILKDRLLSPTLITPDGRSVLIIGQVENATIQLLVDFQARFRKTLTEKFPNATTSVGGVPAVQTDLGLLLIKELKNFLGLTILACILVLFAMFRTWSTVFVPLVLTLYVNLLVFAFMALAGLEFTVVSSTIPIIVFIEVVQLSAHFLLRIKEEANRCSAGTSRWDLIVKTTRAIWLPNLLGSATTLVGFLTLISVDVPLIRGYAISVSAAVFLSWLIAGILVIPLMLLMPLPEPRPWVYRPAYWALWLIKHRRTTIALTSFATVALFIIGQKQHWTARLFDDLPKGQEARWSTEKIDSSMGGVIPLEVVISAEEEDAWTKPANLRKLDRFVSSVRKLEGVGSARSLPDFLKASFINKGQLPKSKQAVAEIFFLYSLASYDPLQAYLADQSRSVRIEVKLKDVPSNQAHALLRRIHELGQVRFPGADVKMGGMGAIVHTIHDELSHELIFGFWHALLIIVAFLAVVFRSFRWAIVAIIPNLIPPIFLLGFLSLAKIPIKPGVAIIFSIALGLAFTNTVYLFNRIRELARADRSRMPIKRAFFLEANPCLISTLIVMVGFSVFLFSYFSLNVTFGVFMLVSILAGLLGDLVLLPAVLQEFPGMLGNKRKSRTIVPLAKPVPLALDSRRSA